MDNWNNNQVSDENSSTDNKALMQFVGKVLHNWYFFLIGAVLCSVIAAVYVRYKTPMYKINAKLLVNDEKKGGGGAGVQGGLLDLGGLLGGKSSVDNEAEILKTRFLMQEVVKELDANITYFKKGRLRDVELYESPFKFDNVNVKDSIRSSSFTVRYLDNDKLEVSNDDFSKVVGFDQPFILEDVGKVKIQRNIGVPFRDGDYLVKLTSVDGKVASFMNNLEVAVSNKLVSIIDLSYSYPIQKKGEDILNALIEKYVEANLNDKNRIADSTIAFVEDRLLFVGQELGDIEGNIQQFKQKSEIANITEQSRLLLENSSQNLEELSKVETQLSVLSSLEEYLKDGTKNKRVFPSSLLPGDMIFTGLIDRYNNLLLERDRQSLSATETNPYIANLDEQISNLRKDMLSNLVNTRNSLTITRNQLRSRSGASESKIRQVPAIERTYLDLARQQQIKQELYIFLLQKREETAISKTSNISSTRVIDPPKSSPEPFSPDKKKTVLIGFILGLIIPFGAIYARGVLNTRILSKEDILQSTKIPIVAEISNNPGLETIVVTKDARSPISEQFRALRTNLSFFLGENEKTILLTSSMSGEGKSFVALNIATVLAISGKKVVVMEMDLRKPNLSNKLNIKNNFGFTNFIISSNVASNEITVPSGVHENLYIISSGPIPPNPAETILNGRMDDLIQKLKQEFDYIIIDAPPIGLVTDAQLLAKYADLTLYLVRQRYTYKNQLHIADDLYRNKKMNKIALLVNDIKETGNTYGYGYGYGYGAGYGYGEYGETKSSSFWDRFKSK